jgi:hypothetical protein
MSSATKIRRERGFGRESMEVGAFGVSDAGERLDWNVSQNNSKITPFVPAGRTEAALPDVVRKKNTL